MDSARRAFEIKIVFLIGAVQFVNILDFVMVMPLGPDFARALGIPLSHLGALAAAYTGAGAIAGLLGSVYLERFDRRSALGVALSGLVLGTAAGGLATGLPSLLAARALAGFFGGPATSLAIAVIADTIPAERRGRAMGAIMAAFSVASVVGVPAGLALARIGGWRAPFFGVAALGLVLTVLVIALLPRLRAHLETAAKEGEPGLAHLLGNPLVWLSYAMTFAVMMSGFLVIPNLSAFVQGNLGYPRARLDSLYFYGGIISFFASRYGGRAVDRMGSAIVGSVGAGGMIVLVGLWFVLGASWLHPIAFFMGFMLVMGLRNVSYNTLTSKVPSLRERARFLSLQSSVAHAAIATAGLVASTILSEDHGRLVGTERLGVLTITLTLLVPVMLFVVERRVGIRASGLREPPQLKEA